MRLGKRGGVPFWLVLLVLFLLIFTLLVIFNHKVAQFISEQVRKLGMLI